MSYQEIDGVLVWGEPLENAVEQALNCKRTALYCALMADHHLGYAVPIGGVVAYENRLSPSGVGYDIACGNKAVRLDIPADEVRKHIAQIMDDIWKHLSFGIGRNNQEEVDDPLFDDDPAWDIDDIYELYGLAERQLGTIGSGNHYVDVFIDELGRVWVGVHFGSRGLGHKIATHYLRLAGGKDDMMDDPVVFDVDSQIGQEYIAGMKLAGRYAYAGRDWVCSKVASLLGAQIVEEIHNHHNFAWEEEHDGRKLWVVRKGATPAFPGQKGFVGGSMGENSVIIEGVDGEESKKSFYSTVHGAGRVMSRTKASGKFRWKNIDGKRTRVKKAGGLISREMMNDWMREAGVTLRGAGTDESPHCYKRLSDVLEYHHNSIRVLHTLKPIGVAMAGENEFDPFKD